MSFETVSVNGKARTRVNRIIRLSELMFNSYGERLSQKDRQELILIWDTAERRLDNLISPSVPIFIIQATNFLKLMRTRYGKASKRQGLH